MRSRRKKLCVLLLLLTLFVYIVLLLFQWHLEKYLDKPFTFNLINTPYARLENATCVLQTSGQWKCPDIRTQGPSKLRQSQLVMTRMLLVFDALAKKHNLRYWITRGTLLGAARHKGFIPWDIDLDIEMPIEDYLRFLEEGAKELPLDTILQQHAKEQSLSKTDANHLHELRKAVRSPWNPRLRDKKSCYMTCMKKKCNWQDGLMIDIYPIVLRDGYFTDQFALSTRVWRYLGIDRGVQYKAYPLQRLEFEGFQLPAPNEWKKQLLVTYGEFYMDLPPVEKQYPPDGTVPEPNMTCPRF